MNLKQINPLVNDLPAIDELIRQGAHEAAREALNKIETREVRRPELARFANLLRRAGLIKRSLRALHTFVRDPSQTPSEAESLEYALSLVAVGGVHEAARIFETLNTEKNFAILLYKTFAMTPEWRYEETIPLLEKFLERTEDTNAYLRLIARVNLIAARIFCDQPREASEELTHALKEAESQRSWFLMGSLHELDAQIALSAGDYSSAEAALARASDILRKTGGIESHYVDKWRVILNFRRSPNEFSSRALSELRASAAEAGYWETVRDCDFQNLRAMPEAMLFQDLYCGSPAASFRKRLASTFKNLLPPEGPYQWRLKAGASPVVIHLEAARCGKREAFTDIGHAPHHLLIALARDAYRPQEIAKLSAAVFPGDHYHPIHTPEKIHQLFSRLRADFREGNVPLVIHCERGLARLQASRACTLLREWRDGAAPDAVAIELKPIFEDFSGRDFTTKDVALKLDVSISSAARKLEAARIKGWIVKDGTGRATRFRKVS